MDKLAMEWKYADFSKIGGNAPDETNIIPALDQNAGSIELRPVLNIADPAMLVESAFDRFTEEDMVKPAQLAPTPLTDDDKVISFVLNSTQLDRVKNKVSQQANIQQRIWFSRENLAAGPWGDDNYWIGGDLGTNWGKFLADTTFGGQEYKGLLNITDENLDYGNFAYPLVQINGEPKKDKDIRAIYYAMSKMKTRFFEWPLDIQDVEYIHTNNDFPLAGNSLYSWWSHVTPSGYVQDICTPKQTPLHKLEGAIDITKFSNVQVLMTLECGVGFTFYVNGFPVPITLTYNYNTIESGQIDFRYDIGESAIRPMLLGVDRLKQEVIGRIGPVIAESMEVAKITTPDDWREPFDPRDIKAVERGWDAQEASININVTQCYVIADRQLHTDLAKYYN